MQEAGACQVSAGLAVKLCGGLMRWAPRGPGDAHQLSCNSVAGPPLMCAAAIMSWPHWQGDGPASKGGGGAARDGAHPGCAGGRSGGTQGGLSQLLL